MSESDKSRGDKPVMCLTMARTQPNRQPLARRVSLSLLGASITLSSIALNGGSVAGAEATRPISKTRPANPASAPKTSPATIPSDAPSDCLAAMRTFGWDAEPFAADKSQALCVIDTPVRLKRLSLSDGVGRSIDFPARPVLACQFAIRLGQWARELAAPLAIGYLATELKSIETGPGFECRTRNRDPNAKLSAHGSGIAIDIAGFGLANGKHVAIARTTSESEGRFVAALRAGACGWFTTILGPGSDAAHATHIHFDSLQHGSSANYRICQ